MSPSIHKLNKMLKAEIIKSTEYAKTHGGSGVAEGFDDFVNEILRSDTVAGALVGRLLTTPPDQVMAHVIGAHVDIAQLQKSGDVTGKVGTVVANHPALYGTSLCFAYWAMQVGREVERAEAKLLASLDNPTEVKLAEAEAIITKVGKLADEFEAGGYNLQAEELRQALKATPVAEKADENEV